jgi:hypothetical protein
MLCDWSTYDPKSDVIARDLVYTDGDIETFMGYYNPKHRYHYVSDQREDEAWIFVQCDSTNGKGTAIPGTIDTQALMNSPRRSSHCVREPTHIIIRCRKRKH